MANANSTLISNINPALQEVSTKLSLLNLAIEGLHSFAGSELETTDIEPLAYAIKDIKRTVDSLLLSEANNG